MRLVPSHWSALLHVEFSPSEMDAWEVRAGLRERATLKAPFANDSVYARHAINEREIYALAGRAGGGALADLIGQAAEKTVRGALQLFALRRLLIGHLAFALYAADNDEGHRPETMGEMWRLDNAKAKYEERAALVLRWTEYQP